MVSAPSRANAGTRSDWVNDPDYDSDLRSKPPDF